MDACRNGARKDYHPTQLRRRARLFAREINDSARSGRKSNDVIKNAPEARAAASTARCAQKRNYYRCDLRMLRVYVIFDSMYKYTSKRRIDKLIKSCLPSVRGGILGGDLIQYLRVLKNQHDYYSNLNNMRVLFTYGPQPHHHHHLQHNQTQVQAQ